MAVSLFIAIMGPVYGGLATASLPLAFLAVGAVIVTAFLITFSRNSRAGVGVRGV